MSDTLGKEHLAMNRLSIKLKSQMCELGYVSIDTPIIENTRLFERKSTGEFAGQLYRFTDPEGKLVTLRPEFTSSIIRILVEQNKSKLDLPVRYQYNGPVFRYKHDRPTQTTQIGAELIGNNDIEADLEILSVARLALKSIGIKQYKLRLGHLGLFTDVMEKYNVSNTLKLLILNNIGMLKHSKSGVLDLINQAQEIGIAGLNNTSNVENPILTESSNSNQQTSRKELADKITSPYGKRSVNDVIDRLIRENTKLEDPLKMAEVVETVSELSKVEGDIETSIKLLEQIFVTRNIRSKVLEELPKTINRINNCGDSKATVMFDCGLVRDVHYYTGMVFEISCPTSDKEISLGGGGRYDDLVNTLGGNNIPALGFAFELEKLLQVETNQPLELKTEIDNNKEETIA